jgi:23S rRNA (adenine-N6)-dimethyltransferase
LVFDLGAGFGALTAPLAGTGARVVAIELDPALAGRLRRRFGADPLVSVVEADLRRVPLPRRPFHVVASPPFALTTLLCWRLLGDRALRLAGAELILEWGAAKWLSSRDRRDREIALWASRYQIRLVRRIPANSFSPAPSSDAAHVRIRPRLEADRGERCAKSALPGRMRSSRTRGRRLQVVQGGQGRPHDVGGSP